ncbi:MAG: IspD/TarI family cytidylyltransferase [Clostridia bacterium]|nr:IspD/TarI family cytidylyltransferase [Clostridia bacterium]
MIAAGIVAGGTGSRMGNTDMPKQFMDLCGKPVIIHTIQKFLDNSMIDIVVIGINPEWHDYMDGLAEKYFHRNDKIIITDGGADRNGTIINIISELEKHGAKDDCILVTHDAVRPFVTGRMIDDSINKMENYDICTVAIPATDTIVCSDNGITIDNFPLRKTMFQEQTPQTFRTGTFKKVYSALNDKQRKDITDACKLFYISGYKVKLIQGDVSNIKLTYPDDLIMAKFLMENKNKA